MTFCCDTLHLISFLYNLWSLSPIARHTSLLTWHAVSNRTQRHQHLTHWGRVTHICVGNLTIISSDNGVSPGRRQAIIWTNAEILLIRTLGTNFSEILGEIHSFSFSEMHLKMSSAKWRLFGLGLNVLTEPRHFMWTQDELQTTRSQCLRFQQITTEH